VAKQEHKPIYLEAVPRRSDEPAFGGI